MNGDRLQFTGDDSPLVQFSRYLIDDNIFDAKRIVTRGIAHKRDAFDCGFIWYFMFHGKHDDPTTLQYLLDQGATLDAPKASGYYSPLQQAICYGKVKVLRALLNIGVGVNVYVYNCTSLELALKRNLAAIAKILLDAGANLGLVNRCAVTIPEWVHRFVKHREYVRQTTLIVLGLKRARSRSLGCVNGKDVLCVIARCVWETRGRTEP